MELAQVKDLRVIIWGKNDEILNIVEVQYKNWTSREVVEYAVQHCYDISHVEIECLLTDNSRENFSSYRH